MDALEEDWDNPNSTSKIHSQVFNKSCNNNKNDNVPRDMHKDKSNECRRQISRGPISFGWKQKDKAKDCTVQNDKPGDSAMVMKVDFNKIGKLIGKQGVNIKRLEEKSGARIKIGKISENDPYSKEIRLIGNEKAQQECKELIEELLAERRVFYTTTPPEEKPVVIDWDAVNEAADKARAERWSKVPPIKKNFYIEDPEVANMSDEEVREFRGKNCNIVVEHVLGETNEKILNPIKTFRQAFKCYPEILQEIEKQGFEVPSPIQCQAWPILLSGKDLIGIAQTGTGKTLAFLLPALIHIDGQETPRSQRVGPNVLIIAPTRELALQIESEVEKYSYKGIKSVCVYGGASRRNQITLVTRGVEIIIATPGRLNDLVTSKYINLDSVTYVVLDEADRMLDMGFDSQIRKVLLDIRPDRQSVMTSATWPPNVQSLAARYMCNPIQVYIGSLDLAVVKSVSQTVLVVRNSDKFEYLLDFVKSLNEDDKVIVFVTKKVEADHISCDLSMAGILCQCIHGDREQMDREQAIDDLRSGAVRILIATDVASRGLDITDITKVFNYDFPKNMEEYVHRAGRTGRAGKEGEVITLFTSSNRASADDLIKILEEAEQPIPEDLLRIKGSFLRYQQMCEGERKKPGYRPKNFQGRRGRNE